MSSRNLGLVKQLNITRALGVAARAMEVPKREKMRKKESEFVLRMRIVFTPQVAKNFVWVKAGETDKTRVEVATAPIYMQIISM